MHCRSCGRETPPGTACAHCGAELSEAAVTILPGLPPTLHGDLTAIPAPGHAVTAPPARSSATTTPTALGPGQQFGRYHILKLLGTGGMGSVYHAWDHALGMAVPLRGVRPDTRGEPGGSED